MKSFFKPQIVKDNRRPDGNGGNVYMTFALEVKPCPICSRLMMNVEGHRHVFPAWVELTQLAQMETAGVVPIGGYIPGNSWGGDVCEICTKEGKITFECYICHEQRTSDQRRHEGIYSETVCLTCYETVPAKRWDEIEDEIMEAHRWDNS